MPTRQCSCRERREGEEGEGEKGEGERGGVRAGEETGGGRGRAAEEGGRGRGRLAVVGVTTESGRKCVLRPVARFDLTHEMSSHLPTQEMSEMSHLQAWPTGCLHTCRQVQGAVLSGA